jgi:cytochrome c oxidase subunit 2
MSKKILALTAVLSTLTLLGAGCSNLGASNNNQPADPAITVSDQKLESNNEIVISKASLPEDGWIDIHAKENGQAGATIGYTALKTGTDTNIKITVDRTKVTPSLIAMLHYDRDPKGSFDFPGTDGPVIKDTQVIMKEFTILNQGEISTETPPTTSNTGTRKEFVISAKQWSFSPSSIKVKKGDRVVLKVTSTDVAHGFSLAQFGINETLEPGKTKTIEFVADKVGTFTFSCSVPCGAGHKAMSGTLIVE